MYSEPWECGLHDNVAINSKIVLKPLNYVKPTLHLVIKFLKIMWISCTVEKKSNSYYTTILPGNLLPLGNLSRCRCNKHESSFIWGKPKSERKHYNRHGYEPSQHAILHTDTLYFTAFNAFLFVKHLATWQKQLDTVIKSTLLANVLDS